MKSFRSRLSALLSLSMLVALLPLTAAPALADVGEGLVISGVFDGPLSGGFPKFIEVTALTEVDLLGYGLGSANNGGGTDGQEFTFAAGTLAAGESFCVSNEIEGFEAYFGVSPEATSGAASINGDDAIELFLDGVVVDVFGDINVDGTGQPWEHLDGFAARSGGGPDGSTFVLGNWTFSGPNALDGETSNDSALAQYPLNCGVEPPGPVFTISELDADQVSTDTAEFVEVYDGGVGSTALDGLVLVLVNGSDDLSYGAVDLDGATTNADGFYVVNFASNGLQNGADAVALYEGDAVDYPNDTAVNTTALLDVLIYDINKSDDAGLLALFPGTTQINEDGLGDKDNHSIQWCDGGWTQAAPTPGSENCAFVSDSLITINEVDADTPGNDTAEFIELFDGGVGNTSLDGLVLVLVNGSDDLSYGALDLDGETTDSDGYFLKAYPSNGIQNGPDAVALYEGDAVDYPNDTAVSTAGLLDVLIYDTNDGDDDGLAAIFPGVSQINEGGLGDKDNHSNQWCDGGWTQFLPTPGTENCVLAPVAVKIHEVQGSGSSSPMEGTLVEIQGVVVGDFQTGGLNGFHVQEEDADADADASTSEGVFVFYPFWVADVDVQLGDVVTVIGPVSEFNGLTEISANSVVVDGTGASVSPAELSLPLGGFVLETVEGMSVHFGQSLVIAEYFNFDRFGEIVLTTERAFQPTASYAPGTVEADEAATLNADSRITLDDGQTAQNPFFSRHPNGLEFTSTNYFRGGDTLTDVVGVMDYSFGNYKIQPTGPASYTVENPRPAAPAPVGGGLTVATFNVLNYFSTLDGGGSICGPSSNQGCRGADNASEFDRQRTKIIAAIAVIDADVVGLMEIENHATDAALIDLVDGLNAVMGAGTYARVDSGTPGDDVIKVALIYKPSTVSAVGASAVLDTPDFVDPLEIGSDKNRAAIAQAFVDDATGVGFVVSVNHLKSKGSSCGAGDDDPEAGSCNATRTAAAGVLADWLDTDPTATGMDNTLIIGDLNSYDHESPIDALVSAGYSDVVRDEIGEDAYSFVFSGQWGYLDYVMADASIAKFITGATIWHINADEADLLDYDNSFKSDAQIAAWTPGPYRSSDHDPVIIGLDFTAPQADKSSVIEDLEGVLGGADKRTARRLESAIESVMDSLAPDWWDGDHAITSKKVFDEERSAVAQLLQLVSKGGDAAATASSAIDLLVEADRELALFAIASAIIDGRDAAIIAEAVAAVHEAEAYLEGGDLIDAINAFKSAWAKAERS